MDYKIGISNICKLMLLPGLEMLKMGHTQTKHGQTETFRIKIEMLTTLNINCRKDGTYTDAKRSDQSVSDRKKM